jgi:hypothetical protein
VTLLTCVPEISASVDGGPSRGFREQKTPSALAEISPRGSCELQQKSIIEMQLVVPNSQG